MWPRHYLLGGPYNPLSLQEKIDISLNLKLSPASIAIIYGKQSLLANHVQTVV